MPSAMVAALAVSLSGAPASVTVAPIEFVGNVSQAQRSAFAGAQGEGLAKTKFQLRPAEASCTDLPCALEDAREGQSRFLLATRVVGALRDYEINVDVLDATSGAVIVSGQETCAPCGGREAAAVLGRVVAAVGDKLQRRALGPAALQVDVTPRGALIHLDGRAAGRAPMEVELTPGVHVVVARSPGYVDARRKVTAVEGVRETISLSLLPLPRPKPRRVPIIAGFGLLGTGTAVSAAGLVLLGLHGRPDSRRCDGLNVDADGDCAFMLSSRRAGVALSVAGVTAAITGAVVLALEYRRSRL